MICFIKLLYNSEIWLIKVTYLLNLASDVINHKIYIIGLLYKEIVTKSIFKGYLSKIKAIIVSKLKQRHIGIILGN